MKYRVQLQQSEEYGPSGPYVMGQPMSVIQRGLSRVTGNVLVGERAGLVAEHSGLKAEVNKSHFNTVLVAVA